jgi:hypothetical protein
VTSSNPRCDRERAPAARAARGSARPCPWRSSSTSGATGLPPLRRSVTFTVTVDLGSISADVSVVHADGRALDGGTARCPTVRVDFSGWVERRGRHAGRGGAPGSTVASLHFRANLNNDCNGVHRRSSSRRDLDDVACTSTTSWRRATSTGPTSRAWTAKTGEKFLLTPTGALYNHDERTELLCDNLGNLQGWSGSIATWRQANFDLSPYAGRRSGSTSRVDRSSRAGQPGFLDGPGPVRTQRRSTATRRRSCAALPPEVSPREPGAADDRQVGTDLVLTFSESAGATAYNLYRGSLRTSRRGSTTTRDAPACADSRTGRWRRLGVGRRSDAARSGRLISARRRGERRGGITVRNGDGRSGDSAGPEFLPLNPHVFG